MRRQIVYVIPYHTRWSLFFPRVLFGIGVGFLGLFFALLGVVRLLHYLSTFGWSL